MAADLEFHRHCTVAAAESGVPVPRGSDSFPRMGTAASGGALLRRWGAARIVVAAPEALVQRTLPKEVLMNHVLRLHLSDTVDLNALGERLVHLGYTRCQQVEGMGQLRCAAAFWMCLAQAWKRRCAWNFR